MKNVHPFEREGGVALNGIKSTAGHVYLGHERGAYRFLSADRFDMSDELVGEDKKDVGMESIDRFKGRTQFVAVAVDLGTFIVRKDAASPAILVHNRSGGARFDPDPNPFRVTP